MDQYSIIGGDGKEYGPVSAEEISNWVKAGRANAQTQTIKNGSTAQPMGSFPEFAPLFGGAMGGGQGLSLSPREPGPAVSGSPTAGTGSTAMSSTSQDARGAVITLMEPIARAAFWMKLVAVVSILGGAFSVLSIWGIVIAWIPIWQGILLWKAASRAQASLVDGSELTAEASLSSIKTYFTLMGVLMLLYIVFFVGMIILVFAMGGAGVLEGLEQQGY